MGLRREEEALAHLRGGGVGVRRSSRRVGARALLLEHAGFDLDDRGRQNACNRIGPGGATWSCPDP